MKLLRAINAEKEPYSFEWFSQQATILQFSCTNQELENTSQQI